MSFVQNIRAYTAGSVRPWLREQRWFQSYKRQREESEYFDRLKKYSPIRFPSGLRGELLPDDVKIPVVGERSISTIFIAPRVSWHATLHRCLSKLGASDWIDFDGHFYYDKPMTDSSWAPLRDKINARIRSEAERIANSRRIDWVLVYSEGCHIHASTLKHLREELGLKVVLMCLDDKQHWDGPIVCGQHVYQLDILPHCDLYWTSSKICLEWLRALSVKAVYMPEGCDPEEFYPTGDPKDKAVTFVGAKFGFRDQWVRSLVKIGIPLDVFGKGWPAGPVPAGGLNNLFNRSIINLGHGGVNYSPVMFNMKGRDFEVPCSGGLYCTTFSSSLAACYSHMESIVFYREADDLYESLFELAKNPEKILSIGRRARSVSISMHTWQHRFRRISGEL